MLNLKRHLISTLVIICLKNNYSLGITDYNISLEDTAMFPVSSFQLNSTFSGNDRKLIQLHIFFRHGMRAPDFLYPKDPNPVNAWKEGLGRLTQLGKYQNYALGRQLRRMYKDFITSHPREVNVLSAKRNRCILSALCHVAALYAPNENWQFVPDFPWQPIPVKYQSIGNDKFLGIDKECPAARAEANNISNSDEGKEIMESHKEMFKDLQHLSGYKIDSLTDAEELAEILAIEKANNFIVPSWATQYWKELDYINHAACYLRVESKKYQRLRAGPLLGYIKRRMERRISGEGRKVYIYSGHKKTVTAVLAALDVYNRKEPPFCATVIFELYKEREGNSVRLLYFNSTTPENGDQVPHVLKLPKCEEFCPLENFVRVARGLDPYDWEKECQL
ncbi:Prostatic acid phosphatase, partial [Stegodyphus mimosarum]